MSVEKTLLKAIIVLLSLVTFVESQYRGGNSYGYNDESTNPEVEIDERPKIRFGIKLRVPAMRVDIPRFNMPKITINAKIRQPDGPRVIRLPAINLDTSSNLEAPESQDQTNFVDKSYRHRQSVNRPLSPKQIYAENGNYGSSIQSNSFIHSDHQGEAGKVNHLMDGRRNQYYQLNQKAYGSTLRPYYIHRYSRQNTDLGFDVPFYGHYQQSKHAALY